MEVMRARCATVTYQAMRFRLLSTKLNKSVSLPAAYPRVRHVNVAVRGDKDNLS